MIFGNPVRGFIYTTLGGNRWYRSQPFGCTGFPAERPFGSCAHFHRGLDIANGRCGDDVIAAAAGTVHWAGRDAYGSIDVELDHGGGWFSVVAHLEQAVVATGQHVVQGQKIGVHGQTGHATGCHIHFAIKDGMYAPIGSVLGDDQGTWVDPWTHLAQNTVVVPPKITVHPKGAGVNIRATASTIGAPFATCGADGHIRKPDGTDLGLTATPRTWGGTVVGGGYTSGGGSDDHWEKAYIGGGWRFIATPYAVKGT